MATTGGSVWTWFGVFCFSLLATSGLGISLSLRSARWAAIVRKTMLFTVGIAGSLFCYVSGAEMLHARAAIENDLSKLVNFGVLFAISMLVLAQGSAVIWLMRRPGGRRGIALTSVLLLGNLGACAGAGVRYYDLAEGTADAISNLGHELALVPVENTVIVTDVGRRLPVYRARLSTSLSNCDHRSVEAVGHAVIRESVPDDATNCHGWVFTGGRFLVSGDHVDSILEDNAYVMVVRPEVGDLVVYRDPDLRVLHTGVVRGILDDGTPLIESKWGVGGRFLHRPLDQVYSRDFTYYHSARRAGASTLLERNQVDLLAVSL